jgi:DNA primase catalytic core
MARVPEVELERLKREVSVRRLAESRGVVFKKSGDDNWLGLCPLHPDKSPSLVVSEKKNVWHCLGACRAGGGPIDFVMKAEGVNFRHAVELLREGVALEGPVGPKHATIPKLPSPLVVDADDAMLLRQVREYYHQQLKLSPEAIAYLASRGLNHPALIDAFHLGFANRTLSLRIPDANRLEGAKLRGRLQKLGVWRESGHEHLSGSLVVPIHDEAGAVVGMYGRKVTRNLRAGTPNHLYLPGPHRAAFNSAALAEGNGSAIVCEALIDALSFWAAGFRNVTAAYGVEGFTPHHLEALKRHRVKHVVIAYDRDAAGDAGALALAKQLEPEGFDCFRAVFPHSLDANDVACKVLPASKSLGLVLSRAAFMGTGVPRGTPNFSSLAASPPANTEAPTTAVRGSEGGKRVAPTLALKVATVPAPANPLPGHGAAAAAPTAPAEVSCEPTPEISASSSRVEISASPSAALTTAPSPAITEPAPAAPTSMMGTSANTTPPTSTNDDEALIHFGPRRYRVRGLLRPHTPDSLRLNILLGAGDAFHVDTFDLYSAKARVAFVQAAAAECRLDADTVKRDVGQLLLQLETLLDKRREDAKGPKVPVLTEDEREAALALLRTPELLTRILEDFGRCGVVGEETNKLVGYLAAVSRKLDEPLAILIQSSSAAGKSSLMEAVLAFVPEEEKTKFSAMTGQALFYMGDVSLSHKVLAVVEEEGASRASYALKLLQSEGELTIASTGKDPHSGRLVTHEYHVEGPTQLFLTTTATDIDDELLNRCLVLSVDEDRAQTSAIHEKQRHKRTLEGRLEKKEKEATLKLHQNAQRLLRPLVVVNPFALQLTFPDAATRARRDFPKYLTLIEAIALLHQYQRPVKTAPWHGGVVEYVEVTLEDITTANRLASAVLGRSLDELPPQTRRLLAQLELYVGKRASDDGVPRAEVRFTRREVREALKWGDTQLKVHLGRLSDMELLAPLRTAHGGFSYTLRGTETAMPALIGLMVPGATTTTDVRSALGSSGRGAVGPRSAPTPTGLSTEKPSRLFSLAASSRAVGLGANAHGPSAQNAVVAAGGDAP